MNSLIKVINQFGITTQEACEAISYIPKIQFTEMDIILIKSNTNINFFQKWKLINKIKKQIKKRI